MMRWYARGGVSSSASTSSRSSIASKTLRKSSQESCSMYSRLPLVPPSRRLMSRARRRREAVDEIGVARRECDDALVTGAYVAPEGDRGQHVVGVGIGVVQQDGDALGRDAGAEQGREHLLALRWVQPQPEQRLLVA